LNHDLRIIKDWSIEWHATFNPNKTDVVIFSGNLPAIELIIFYDSPLNVSDSHKHLGITFSSNCKLTLRIEIISKSVAKDLSMLRKMKSILNRQTLSKLFTIFIRSLLEYACELWDGCTNTDSEKLDKLQLEAAGIVSGLPCYASRQISLL